MTQDETRTSLMLALLTDETWRPRYDKHGKPYMWLRVDPPPEEGPSEHPTADAGK